MNQGWSNMPGKANTAGTAASAASPPEDVGQECDPGKSADYEVETKDGQNLSPCTVH
jgi:hypothetical protein